MNGGRIFLAWFLTVIAGSIGLPLMVLLYRFVISSNPNVQFFGSEIFYVILISIVVSGICSLPTIITLLVRNSILNKKKLILKVHFKKITITHIIMALLTLLVFDGIMFINMADSYRFKQEYGVESSWSYRDLEGLLSAFLVIVWYSIMAFVCWYLLFKSKLNLSEPGTQDILDN